MQSLIYLTSITVGNNAHHIFHCVTVHQGWGPSIWSELDVLMAKHAVLAVQSLFPVFPLPFLAASVQARHTLHEKFADSLANPNTACCLLVSSSNVFFAVFIWPLLLLLYQSVLLSVLLLSCCFLYNSSCFLFQFPCYCYILLLCCMLLLPLAFCCTGFAALVLSAVLRLLVSGRQPEHILW